MQFLPVLAFLLLVQGQKASPEELGQSQREVLAHLREAINQYSAVDLQASVDARFPIEGDGVGVESTVLTVKRLGSRALISLKDVVERPGHDVARFQRDFVVYENGDVLLARANLDRSLRQMPGRQRLAIGLYSARLAGTQELDRESVYFALNDDGAALWIVGYRPILDYIDSASEIHIAQRGNGAEIQATSEYGRLTLTLSHSSGWLPEAFEVTKTPESKTIGGRVADVHANAVRAVVWTGEANGFESDAEDAGGQPKSWFNGGPN